VGGAYFAKKICAALRNLRFIDLTRLKLIEAEREVKVELLGAEEGQGRCLFVEGCGPKGDGKRK
jgi:hypothetical protein